MTARRLGLCAAIIALACAGTADASQYLARNAHDVVIQVDARGEALVSYTVAGRRRHVLVWGAVNAVAPSARRKQVAFATEPIGDAKYRSEFASKFKNLCLPYDGPAIPWLVAACKANDGSYWALQAWQRQLPDHDAHASATQVSHELSVSHWTGDVSKLEVKIDWGFGHWERVIGRLTYRGVSASGKGGTPSEGIIYIDTFGSAYGRGWRRAIHLRTSQQSGVFCYGFGPLRNRGGRGVKYRVAAQGPGVTPDVQGEVSALGPFDPLLDAKNRGLIALVRRDRTFSGCAH